MENASGVNCSKELLCSLLILGNNDISVAGTIPNDKESQGYCEVEDELFGVGLLVDVIDRFLHASNNLNSASQAAILKG